MTSSKSRSTKVLIVVPLRLASQRLSEKILRPIGDKSVAVRACEQALKLQSKNLGVRVVAAVDDKKTLDHLRERFPENELMILMTAPELPSGTDRVFGAYKLLRKKHPSLVRGLKCLVNIQGDMPFFDPEPIAAMIRKILKQKNSRMAMWTLAEEWPYPQNPTDMQFVKVVCDKNERALYFSRHSIPCSRNFDHKALRLHVGVYAYTVQALKSFCTHKPCEMEKLEGLEQLRALYHGIPIYVFDCPTRKNLNFRGIDVAEDYTWAQDFAQHAKE
jgi:3-deoxy-manno-octulosonate cytidylyltransferase (CMP-KDO synthetase)